MRFVFVVGCVFVGLGQTGVFAAEDAVAAAAAPVTAQSLQRVEDFGALDLEMATVSDFNQLDLESLLNIKVETASKKSESISRAPALIEVLTREQLFNLGARDLYTALTFLPGIEKIENFSGSTTLIFRGMPQEQFAVRSLLLINGHPTFEPTSSQFPLEIIPLEAIDRIEVVRGPGSVLYGNNAFAGVINVITVNKPEDGQTTLAHALGGHFTTGEAGVGNYGRGGKLRWTTAVSGRYSKGYAFRLRREQIEDCNDIQFGIPAPDPSVCVPTRTVMDWFNNYANAYGEIGYQGLALQLGGLFQKRSKIGMTASPRFSGTNTVEHFFGDLSYTHAWDTFSLKVRGGVSEDNRNVPLGRFPFPSFAESHVDARTNIYRGEANGSWSLVDELVLDFGGSYDVYAVDRYHFLHENGDFHALAPRFDDLGQDVASVYGQATWHIVENLTAIAGIRASRFQTVNTVVEVGAANILQFEKVDEDPVVLKSPRGALLYSPTDTLTIKALYGEAFRLPNLWETNATMPRFLASTAGIRPEIIRTAELGVDSRPVAWMSLRPAVFYSRIEDLIARRNSLTPLDDQKLGGVGSGGHTANMFDYTIYGGELALQAFFNEQWSLFANGSVKKSKFSVINDAYTEAAGWYQRPTMAPFLFNAAVGYKPITQIALRPNMQYVGPRGATTHHTLFNAVIDYMATDAITVSLIVDNITDERHDYPEIIRRHTRTLPGGPGRAFYGRLNATF